MSFKQYIYTIKSSDAIGRIQHLGNRNGLCYQLNFKHSNGYKSSTRFFFAWVYFNLLKSTSAFGLPGSDHYVVLSSRVSFEWQFNFCDISTTSFRWILRFLLWSHCLQLTNNKNIINKAVSCYCNLVLVKQLRSVSFIGLKLASLVTILSHDSVIAFVAIIRWKVHGFEILPVIQMVFNGMLINERLNGLYSVLVDMVLLPF